MAPVALPVQPSTIPPPFSTQSPTLLGKMSGVALIRANGVPTERVVSPPKATKVTPFAFDGMEGAIDAFHRGEFLVVMDDESRENEGDLIIAADKITAEKMAFLIKHTSGYVCISLPQKRLEELDIPMMLPTNTEKHKTAYTVTVDYKKGTTTGISAHDRALTARMLASSTSKPDDFSRPGHMVPLRARPGGTLQRRGHTEATLDMCRLAGLPLAGLLCEIVNDDAEGTMARRDDCRAFADKWGFKMISVEMIAQHMATLEHRD